MSSTKQPHMFITITIIIPCIAKHLVSRSSPIDPPQHMFSDSNVIISERPNCRQSACRISPTLGRRRYSSQVCEASIIFPLKAAGTLQSADDEFCVLLKGFAFSQHLLAQSGWLSGLSAHDFESAAFTFGDVHVPCQDPQRAVAGVLCVLTMQPSALGHWVPGKF